MALPEMCWTFWETRQNPCKRDQRVEGSPDPVFKWFFPSRHFLLIDVAVAVAYKRSTS